MDMLTCGVGGIASRTPVDFGGAVLDCARRCLPDYTPMRLEHAPRYLLFGFNRQIEVDRFMYVIIIADKTSGKVGTEVGLNIRDKMPYYRISVPVQFGTFGFRERADFLLNGHDYSYVYRSKDDLIRTLNEVLNLNVSHAQRAMIEKLEIDIEKSKSTWIPLYEEWQLAEQAAESMNGCELRYPDLVNEAEIRQFIQKKIADPLTMRYLGGLRSSYKDPGFLNAHVYLMSRGMDFLGDGSSALNISGGEEQVADAQQSQQAQRITWSDIMGSEYGEKVALEHKMPKNAAAPLDDVTLYLTGRVPQSQSVRLSDDYNERCFEFAFYKTLSVMEGLYRPQSKGGFFQFN